MRSSRDRAAPVPKRIRALALCIFRYGDEILVTHGFDHTKGEPFHRPLGGGVEPGESSFDAVKREIREELDEEVEELELLGVLENIFTYEGEAGHEIVFVYDGRFVDASVYDRRRHGLVGVEENGEPLSATWRGLDTFDDHDRLVPEGLLEILNFR